MLRKAGVLDGGVHGLYCPLLNPGFTPIPGEVGALVGVHALY